MAGSIKGFQFGAFQFNAFQIADGSGTHSGVNRLAMIELYEKEFKENAERRRRNLGAPKVTSRIIQVPRGTMKMRATVTPTKRQAELHEAAKETYLRPRIDEPQFDFGPLVREALSAIPEQLMTVRNYAAARRRRNALALQAVMAYF